MLFVCPKRYVLSINMEDGEIRRVKIGGNPVGIVGLIRVS